MRSYLLILILFAAAGVKADTDVSIPDLLTQMQAALQNLNYHGTMVYLQEGKMQSMRIVHKVDAEGERERLINLNGPGREVLRHNDEVTCYIPDQKVVMVGQRQLAEHRLSKIADNDFQALQNVYDFRSHKAGRVAGLETRRIDIIPKDNFRYGYRLWLDSESMLLLRSDLLGEDGEILEQTMFADVSIVNFIPLAMLTPVTDGEGFNWYRENDDAKNPEPVESNWQLGSLPMGFTVTGRYRHPLPETPEPAEHWVLSDGLSSVSIYIEKSSNDKDIFKGPSRMGVMHVFGALIAGHQITVIGDVPGATVEMIAGTVSPVSPEAAQ